jgi:hypothetical protein
MAQTQTDAERKRLQRERTAKHREKMKARSVEDALANEQKSRDEFDAYRVTHRLVSPGEIEAETNAESVVDALQIAREFLVALGMPDVQPGETLLKLERRVVTAWLEIGAPLLSRITLKFDHSTGSTTDGFTYDFDTKWVALPGAADLLIDISTLPVIVVPEVVGVSPAVDTPDTPITVEHWRLPAYAPTLEELKAMEHRSQTGLCPVTPREALLLWKQQEAMDEKSRKLSAANEARELANERRLGVSYVPSSELHFRNSR